ncbi:MAG TPA: TerC/Alx family metal homeostasis membrane protein [Ornithinibacter sp.]|nr:TerC/Alx family metal homeostasis membrane protein [Ornithinibacter sp.]
MSPTSLLAAAEPAAAQASIGTPMLWFVTVAAVVLLFVVDFVITRRPHEVSMKEAVGWSAFYVAIPLAFGVWIWQRYGGDRGLEYYTGYLVEKSLSVDNLFVFLLLLTAFAVPRELQQRVLLIGVAGALVLRGVFIALGAQLIASFSWAFLLFGAVLLVTAVKVLRDALSPDDHAVDIGSIRSVRLLRRFMPVTDTYAGTRLTVQQAGRRALTPLALVIVAILGTDVVFAIDSVPAVYGITGDAYLVFATNAFALLGLRALYFVVEGALGSLRHLGHGLAAILAFIGVKLVLHWAHGTWAWVPEVPTLASLGVIVGILALATTTSILANRRDERRGVDVPDAVAAAAVGAAPLGASDGGADLGSEAGESAESESQSASVAGR